jgi:glucose dehydrogenase
VQSIIVDDIMFVPTPKLCVIAVDAANGYEIWSYSGLDGGRPIRAYDKMTGKLLWETVPPNAANATPSTYELNGKQYVVVTAGVGRGWQSGGPFIAFALP